MADPNHPLFLKTFNGFTCLYCKGTNEVFQDGQAVECPWCDGGFYMVPDHRWKDGEPKKIIMQDLNDDVPGCIRYPIATVTDEPINKSPYLTSTLAHMLAYAIAFYSEFEVELYGFEAESNTEYAVQRPCIEYWIGCGRGQGMSIDAPGSHLLTGRHYAYEDYDQGYRSRLELRKRQLQEQINAAEIEATISEGALRALTPFRKIKSVNPAWNDTFDDHFKKKNFVSFLRGTLKELNHAIEILDAYRQDSDEATKADIRRLVEIPYQLG